ncbi:MAG: OmpA family protein [Desulfobacterales bacterium]
MAGSEIDVQAPVNSGAPRWVVTFGDLMSLLLCFFVLLLSFSEVDKAKYKEIAGALKQAFGVQRKVKVLDTPAAHNIIARAFDRELQIATRFKEEIGKAIKNEVKYRFQDLKDKIDVEVRENSVIIRLMGEITFDSGEAFIREEIRPLLVRIGTALRASQGDIVVSGHTDNIPIAGGYRYHSNLDLSAARAVRVVELFMEECHVDPKRVSAMGFGENRPIASNDTAEGRQRNRRVEIMMTTLPRR